MIVPIKTIIGIDSGGKLKADIIKISPTYPPAGIAPITDDAKTDTNIAVIMFCGSNILMLNILHIKVIFNIVISVVPDLCRLQPIGIVKSLISSGMPIFFPAIKLVGIVAAEEHVPRETKEGGIIYFQNNFTPFIP